MQNLRMLIALFLVIFIINWINKDKRRVVPFLTLFFGMEVLNDTFTAGSPIEFANAFGFSFQQSDLLILILGGLCVIDILKHPCVKRAFINQLLLVFCALIFVSSIIGLVTHSATPEWIGDIRTFYQFLVCIAFFSRFNLHDGMVKYQNFIKWIMCCVFVFAIVIWGLDIGFGFRALPSQINALRSDGGSTMRFIQPQRVLIIAIYGIYQTRKDLESEGKLKIITIISLAITVLFQHRSVWMALVAGLCSILFIGRNWKIKRDFLAQIAIIMIGSLAFIMLSNGTIINNIKNAFSLMLNLITGGNLDNTTASTRTKVWEAVINDLSGSALLIGRPFGYGYANSIGWQTSPHSGYIRILGRTGSIGIIIFVSMLLWLIAKNKAKKNYEIVDCLLVFIAFIYSYDFSWVCGAVMGLSMLYIKRNCKYILSKRRM